MRERRAQRHHPCKTCLKIVDGRGTGNALRHVGDGTAVTRKWTRGAAGVMGLALQLDRQL